MHTRDLYRRPAEKFFPESELNAIRGVVEGNFAQNATKLVGKLGISDNNFLNALAGSGAGAVVGGGIGGFAVPVIGTVAREISKKITKNECVGYTLLVPPSVFTV